MIQGFKFHSNNQETIELYDYNSLQNLPQSDKTLSVDGDFADAKKTGDEITNLKNAITEDTRNLFDINKVKGTNITVENGTVSGTASAFYLAFISGIPNLDIDFEPSTQYTFSITGTNEGPVKTGDGLIFLVIYTDNTNSQFKFSNNDNKTKRTITSTSGKTVSKIGFSYSSVGSNTWLLEEIQIEKGTTATTYIPFLTATDYIAREEVINNTGKLADFERSLYPSLWGNMRQLHFGNLLRGTPKVGWFVPYYTGIPNKLESWQYYIVPSPGDFVCWIGGSQAHVAFYDKNGNYLSGALANWQSDYTFGVPKECCYFAYSCPIESDQYVAVASEHDRSSDTSPIALANEVHVNIGNMPDIVKPKKNLFNKYMTISGGYIDYNYKGSFGANDNYVFCPWFIPAKPSTQYVSNGLCMVSEFDKDYNWITAHNMTTFANVQPFTTDDDCKYVRISTANKDGFQLEEGSTSTAYSPFQMQFIGDEETDAPSRTIIVDANGAGNYTTISAACAAANDGDTIYICDGVYYESVKINGLRVHLVGESREGTVLKYLGTQYANPPLEMSNGSIENMTIWAITEQGASGGGGYCLHCDNTNSKDGYLTCRNVKFQNDYYQVVGIGLQPNFILSFENCEFIGQFYCHDCADNFEDLTGQVLRVIDCSIVADNDYFGAIRMQSQERSGASATALFQRCIVKNTGSGPVVSMTNYTEAGLFEDKWLGSSDWTLSEMSALNNSDLLDA